MKLAIKITVGMSIVGFIIATMLWVALARPLIFQQAALKSESNEFVEKKLYQHVKKLSVDYTPRNHQNLNAAAAYIKHQFEEIGYDVIEQKYEVNDFIYKNIIVNIGPQNNSKFVVGAHYDSAGTTPGADDNASGVAGLIELSRLVKNNQLNRPITFVAYTLEEPPYYASQNMGSFVHAKSEKEQNSKIELMISLEMIGYYSDKEGSQKFPINILKYVYPNTGNFIAVIDRVFSNNAYKVKKAMSQKMEMPVYSMNAPAFIPGVDFSDHRSYWAHGYDAVMVTDTSFYRNFKYHTDGDTLDRLDFKKMKQVVDGVYNFIKEHEK
tara:strand:- start:9917 stop:10888 length:972 start_codon:yes stop_codon:yes gene_type:complete